MTGLLTQLFVVLAVTLGTGFALGASFSSHRRPAASATGTGAQTELLSVVEREASLIEALARADADLHARARELAIANEEITCLLEQLHEARHPGEATAAQARRDRARTDAET